MTVRSFHFLVTWNPRNESYDNSSHYILLRNRYIFLLLDSEYLWMATITGTLNIFLDLAYAIQS
jgi:hypothetical protein